VLKLSCNVSDVFPKVLKLSSEVSECEPLLPWPAPGCVSSPWCSRWPGLTLVHFSAHCKRCVWHRGCIKGLLRRCFRGFGRYQGVSMVYFVSDPAQVELKSGRVEAPARWPRRMCRSLTVVREMATSRAVNRGLHSHTGELNLSNSRTPS